MAYFSNSSEGSVLDEQCNRCWHGYDPINQENRRGEPCRVWVLQIQWNYEQLDREALNEDNEEVGEYTPEARIKKQALDTLIPNHPVSKSKPNIITATCKMFAPLEREETS